MYLSELLSKCYVKNEEPSQDEMLIIPAGVRTGADYNMVMRRTDFEDVLVKYRSSEPGSEIVLMTIGRAKREDQRLWDVLLSTDTFVSTYTRMCDDFCVAQLERSGKKEEIPHYKSPEDDAPVSDDTKTKEEETPQPSEEKDESILSGVEEPSTVTKDTSQSEESSFEEKQKEEQNELKPSIEQEEVYDKSEESFKEESSEEESVVASENMSSDTDKDEKIDKEESSTEDTKVEGFDEVIHTSQNPTITTDVATMLQNAEGSFQAITESSDIVPPTVKDALSMINEEDLPEGYTPPVTDTPPEESTPSEEELAEREEAVNALSAICRDLSSTFADFGMVNVLKQSGSNYTQFIEQLATSCEAVRNYVDDLGGVAALETNTETMNIILDILESACQTSIYAGNMEYVNIALHPIIALLYEED